MGSIRGRRRPLARKDAVLTQRLLLVPIALFLIAALALLAPPARAQAQAPRVTEAFTAWDDYFFYAGFQVSDTNVVSTNHTPTSQPQQDDDIEVFFETDGPGKASVRTDKTYQMAVSAGSGAYFSQGDGSSIPKAKLVLTYKYAARVDGTLNNPADKDLGYTIELAIPWVELGMSGPPAPGSVWGFNVVSRDRSSLTTPADRLVSLSPLVQSEADVQNPSKWTKIEFVNTVASMQSGPDIVYCPHVQGEYPVIDGVLASGEWNEADGFSFGTNWISAPAPTEAEEPNISLSPFSQEAQATPPANGAGTSQGQQQTASNEGYDILLPNGGTLHVGRRPNPSATVTPYSPPEEYTPPKTKKGHQKHWRPTQEAQAPNAQPGENPLTPKGYGPLVKPIGPPIDTTQALPLTPQTDVSQLIVAPFVMSYSPQTPMNALLDQPIDGQGIWFGGQQVGWDVNQVRDARRAGVDVLLPMVDPSDPNAGAQLDTLVEAIKEMRANGEDYPLLGLRASNLDDDTAKIFFDHVPEDLLAQIALPDSEDNQPAAIAVADSLPPAAVPGTADAFVRNIGGHAIIMTTPAGIAGLPVATVSPGGRDSTGHIVSRNLAQTYQTSWQAAAGANPDWIYIDSWNDYKDGTEIAASRQYGEQYADLTKVLSLTWTQREWHARYLSNTCPTEIAPDTLYTVTVRIENAGSLPWRVGEGYALNYRWYKDGRLYDQSAPPIPLTKDIYPGECATVGVGVLAQNAYGGAIEPGDYTLVFDMMQGQDRWFTYAGDIPLKVHVKVLASADSVPAYRIRTIATSTPAFMQAGASYSVTTILRNEGSQEWKAGTDIVADAFVGDANSPRYAPLGKVALTQDVAPGSIAYVSVPIQIGAVQSATLSIAWAVQPAGSPEKEAADTAHLDHITLAPVDAGVSFALSDFTRHLKTGEKATAQLGLENMGPATWKPGAYKIGYHWAYLDGTPASDGHEFASLKTAVEPGRGQEVTADFQAPEYPGRYNLIWDMVLPNGKWASAESASHAQSLLVAQVWVTPDKSAQAIPVDIGKDFNASGVGFDSNAAGADFDGKGASIPGVMLPPDGSGEVNGNPILIGQPGPALYPSGYYCGSGDPAISFLYPEKHGNDVVSCHGQSIDLPDGHYRALHLLAAKVGDTASGEASFGLVYSGGTENTPVAIADWSRRPNETGATVAFECPYRLTPDGIDTSSPCILGNYAIPLDSGKKLDRLTLPSDPSIKILAITLEK